LKTNFSDESKISRWAKRFFSQRFSLLMYKEDDGASPGYVQWRSDHRVAGLALPRRGRRLHLHGARSVLRPVNVVRVLHKVLLGGRDCCHHWDSRCLPPLVPVREV